MYMQIIRQTNEYSKNYSHEKKMKILFFIYTIFSSRWTTIIENRHRATIYGTAVGDVGGIRKHPEVAEETPILPSDDWPWSRSMNQ